MISIRAGELQASLSSSRPLGAPTPSGRQYHAGQILDQQQKAADQLTGGELKLSAAAAAAALFGHVARAPAGGCKFWRRFRERLLMAFGAPYARVPRLRTVAQYSPGRPAIDCAPASCRSSESARPIGPARPGPLVLALLLVRESPRPRQLARNNYDE